MEEVDMIEEGMVITWRYDHHTVWITMPRYLGVLQELEGTV